MAEAIYTLKFSDGSQMTGLKLNGNNFVCVVEVIASDFRGKLSHVEISGVGEGSEAGPIGLHEHMELVQVAHYTQVEHGVPDGWYFVLREVSAEEYARKELEGNVEYIAMMTGVEL